MGLITIQNCKCCSGGRGSGIVIWRVEVRGGVAQMLGTRENAWM